MEMDALDRSILEVLQEDGRITNNDLANKVGLSPSAVLRRVRRLEETSIISGYVALVNREAIGKPTSVFVEISLSGQHEDLLDQFEQQIGDVPEVMSCHLMAGNADYLVHVIVADVNDFERIHRSHLAQLPGVSQLRSSFAIRNVIARTAHAI